MLATFDTGTIVRTSKNPDAVRTAELVLAKIS